MTRTTEPASADAPPPAAAPATTEGVGTSPAAPGSEAPQDGERLGLPHERDESTGDTATDPHPEMVRAKKDLDSGQGGG